MSDGYVVIIGNLLDGVRHYGPFDGFREIKTKKGEENEG